MVTNYYKNVLQNLSSEFWNKKWLWTWTSKSDVPEIQLFTWNTWLWAKDECFISWRKTRKEWRNTLQPPTQLIIISCNVPIHERSGLFRRDSIAWHVLEEFEIYKPKLPLNNNQTRNIQEDKIHCSGCSIGHSYRIVNLLVQMNRPCWPRYDLSKVNPHSPITL